MKIAINQPYFLPYLGYFQLIAAADLFVSYENVAYTRKSWVSRNRLRGKAKEPYFISLPTVKIASGALIRDVLLHDTAAKELAKLLRRIRIDYAKAKYFDEVFGDLEEMFMAVNLTSLASFNNHCLNWMCNLLDLESTLSFRHDDLLVFEDELNNNKRHMAYEVKSQRIFGLASHFGANHYLNLSGGMSLYGYDEFKNNELELDFVKTPNIVYPQFQDEFTPHLSILDTILHCGVEQTRRMIKDYKLQRNPKIITDAFA